MSIQPSVIDYEMRDGTTVGLSLYMGGIYSLKKSDKKLYDTVSKVLMDGGRDAVEVLEVLYASYKIANPDSNMSLEEFLEKANTHFVYNAITVNSMINRKKK